MRGIATEVEQPLVKRERESFSMESPREHRDPVPVTMIDAGSAETHHTSPEN